jgi:hypothetical protein
MPVKGTVSARETDRTFQCTRPPEPSRMFERKRRIALSGRVPEIREVKQRYINQFPVARRQSLGNTLRGTNPMGRHKSLSRGDPRYTTQLVASHRSGQKENCSKDRYAGSPTEQKESSLLQERSPAKQAAHPPHDGLCVPRVEVRCPHPCAETTGVKIQVYSPCYWCPLVHNRQINEDLGVPLFSDHIRALTASFDSKLADLGNPLVRQLGRYADRGLIPPSDAKGKGGRGQQASGGRRLRWSSRLNESRSALISRAPFGYPD